MTYFKYRLLTFILALARTRLGSLLLRGIVSNMNKFLPIDRLRETPTLLAFFHPEPSYNFHALIIPKHALRSMTELSECDGPFLIELFQVASSIVAEFRLDQRGYRLILNGGSYQEVGLLHFHLVSDAEI